MTRVFTLTDTCNCTGSMLRNNRLGINVKFAPTSTRCSDSSRELKREIIVYTCIRWTESPVQGEKQPD